MKNLLIFIAIISANTLIGQDLKLFFPEMDAALTSLWLQKDDESTLKTNADFIAKEWKIISPILCKNTAPEEDQYLHEIEESLLEIEVNAARNRLDLVKLSALDLLKQFRAIRFENTSYSYPLDYLFLIHENVEEIDYTVHDLMFGLKYWFEFQDLLNSLNYTWSFYRSIPESELVFYNPSINLEEHEADCLKFESCMDAFFESLDSGYQPDYRLPCNDMKEALINLISIYSNYEIPEQSAFILKQ